MLKLTKKILIRKNMAIVLLCMYICGNKSSGMNQNATTLATVSKVASKTKNLAKNKIVIASVIATLVGVNAVGLTIALGVQNLKKNCYDGWEKVAECYRLAAESEAKENPEYFEHLADYYRCLMYKDLKIYEMQRKSNNKNKNLNLISNCENAMKYYKKASELYNEKANKFEDKTSYDFQINSVKSAELLAKSEECHCEAGDIFHDLDYSKEHECMNFSSKYQKTFNCSSFLYAAEKWEKVKNIKKSYDAYADAKVYECMAKGGVKSWKEAADAWEKVKSDKDLEESFGKKSWEAFAAFAEANRQECLLKCNESTKENVREAWLKTYKLDLEVNNSSAIYKAFAAEANQRANMF